MVQRYTVDYEDNDTFCDSNGEYVLYENYKELEDKYYKMLEKIGDIWREG